MIDPFFFDRLMHAFTTVNATPLSHAAHAATGERARESTSETTVCRALQEAEAVAAAALLCERMTPPAMNQAHEHDLSR